MQNRLISIVLVVAAAVSCDQPTAQAPDDLSIRVAAAPVAPGSAGVTDRLIVAGTNGTLILSDVAIIVSRLELKDDDGECEASSDDGAEEEGDDDCRSFRFAPLFATLPLASGAVTVATDNVSPGTYQAVELRVDDKDHADDDHADDDHRGRREDSADLLRALTAARAAFPDWPTNASLVVAGAFVRSGATDTVAFRAYFNARLKVKLGLKAPLIVNANGASRELTIDVQPAQWFKNGDAVLDLTIFDFTRTKRVVDIDLRKGLNARVDH